MSESKLDAFFITLTVVVVFPLLVGFAVWCGLALLDMLPWPLWRQLELARPRARHNNQRTPALAPAEACRRADSLRRRRQKVTVAIFSLYGWGKSV